MFIGHFAVGFGSKVLAPKANLGWLIAAPLFLDLMWSFFLFSGLERVQIEPGNTAFTPLNFVHYPYTHSLLTAAGWSVLFSLVYFAISRYLKGAVIVGLGVLSHWLLDAVVHRPDLPLYPGSETMVGLGLWNSIAGTIIIEAIIFKIGVFIYSISTRSLDKTGSFVFGGFVGLLLLIYIGNVLGPPPETVNVLAFVALLVWVFPFWAGWLDRHRIVKSIDQRF